MAKKKQEEVKFMSDDPDFESEEYMKRLYWS